MNDLFTSILQNFGHIVCHQIPDRTLWIGGSYLPVCARCTGVYLGFYVGYLMLPFRNRRAEGPPNIFITLSMVIPMIVDGIGQFLGMWTSTNDIRLITGLLFGASISPFLVYLLSILSSTRMPKMIRGIIPAQIDLGKIDTPWIEYKTFLIGISLVAILFLGIRTVIGSTANIFYWAISILTVISIIIHLMIFPIFILYSLIIMNRI